MAKKKSAKVAPANEDAPNDHYVAIQDDQSQKEFGPIKKRKCRDFVFLVLFALFWVGMIVVAVTAFRNGNISKIYQATDSSGAICGVNNTATTATLSDYSTKPYLYFLDPIGLLSTSKSVCISACPSDTVMSTWDTAICAAGTTATLADYVNQVSTGVCSAYTYKSNGVLSICIPDVSTITQAMISASPSSGNTTTELSANNVLSSSVSLAIQGISDLQQTWPVLAVSAGAAVILSYLWLIIIQYFGTIFVWLVLLAFNGILIGGSVWLYFYWKANQVTYGNTALTIDNWEVTASFSAFIAVSCIAGIFLLITIALIKKIQLAIQIIKEATQAVRAMPLIVFFPVWIWLAIVSVSIYFVYIMMLLLTPTTPITVALLNMQFSDQTVSYSMDGYHVFGYLWTFWFLLGVNQMTLAGAVATWYWTRDKSSLPRLPVLKSFYRTCRYHLGSVAIGSLLLAITSFMQLVLLMLKRLKPAKSQIIQWLICCCLCCLKCVQWILKFINKNAYIQIAITGEAFCKAASSAMSLMVKNVLRLAAVDMVSGFILFISKLGIAALVALCAYVFLSYNPFKYNMHFVFLTVVLAGLIALLIAIAFLGVFHLAIDTIFLCFLDDCEMNDGSPERPFYMSDSLKRIVNKANKNSTSSKRIKNSVSVEEF